MSRLIEIPDDGIIRTPIMHGGDIIGERNIDLSDFPVVDAVSVVKCRECKHHHDCETHFCDALGMDCPDDSEFFCAYGERKEGAD